MIILPSFKSIISKKIKSFKIVVGGLFLSFNGSTYNRIAVLNSDGTKDIDFLISNNFGNGFDGAVSIIKIQQDKKIIVGGSFTSYKGGISYRITRLTTNGNLDGTFFVSNGCNNTVNSIQIQSNNKIILGGFFTTCGGVNVNRIVRLNTNGSVDTNFNIGTGFNNLVYTVAVQSDDKIIVGGIFTTYNGLSANRIIRLNSDGTRDTSFNIGTGFNSNVASLVVQSDGKIIVGGTFGSYNGTARTRIIRLNSDGTVDTSFTIGTGFNNVVSALQIQSDGKILAGGTFTAYNGISKSRIARLNSDGTLDSSFIASLGTVNTIQIQSDGKIIAGGSGMTRLNSDGTIDTTFNIGTGFNNTINTISII